MDLLLSLVARTFRLINRLIPWYKLPFPIAVANLAALRHDLREKNLYSTQRTKPPEPAPAFADTAVARSADGSYNDLKKPGMGMAHSRFGRNVPVKDTYPEDPSTLLDPNPRLISTRLLQRNEFKGVPHLNVLAAAWLQFMVHDWFSHGKNAHPDDKSIPAHLREPIEVPIPDGDDWPGGNPMRIHRTTPDISALDDPADKDMPPAYKNTVTQWWDASQLYGSSEKRITELRWNTETDSLEPGGKLYLPKNHLPRREVERTIPGDRPAKDLLEWTGESGNFWIGLSALHTLFAREHNLLCDQLAAVYPSKRDDGDWLFNTSRLIIAALLAKIHTVEWTPGILNTRELRFGMRANWWGLLGERFVRAWGRVIKSEIVAGIIESKTDHHAADYSITEEFNAVYRMHSLVPDEFNFRRHENNELIETRSMLDVQGPHVPEVYDKGISLEDVFYSLGTEHPGLLTLHNFPTTLMALPRQAPAARTVDLATIDVLRDRERGVPRYCAFRRALRMRVPRTFEELTGGNRENAKKLREVYGEVDKVDLLVGCAAEKWPKGFGFSDTAFRIFILMASRRLKSDRFFTTDYTARVYTEFGLRWIEENSFKSVVLRHFPDLASQLHGVKNGFMPWNLGKGEDEGEA